MSYSATYQVYKTVARRLEEYSNGWGTAPVLWDALADRFLPPRKWSIMVETTDHPLLWALAKNPDVPEHLRLCHVFCFDGAVFPHRSLKMLADACHETSLDINQHRESRGEPAAVNHWVKLGDDLRLIKSDRRALGVGLSCTSVCDPWSEFTRTKGKLLNDHEPNIFDGYEYATNLTRQVNDTELLIS